MVAEPAGSMSSGSTSELSTRKDPGLLEQVDFKTFEMRIFPIGAKADQKVEIAYYQELETDHDCATYVYPLATVTRPGRSGNWLASAR